MASSLCEHLRLKYVLDYACALDPQRSGAKAAGQALLAQTTDLVPPGFVISKDAFEAFLDREGLRARLAFLKLRLRYAQSALDIDAASQEARACLSAAPIPDAVLLEIASRTCRWPHVIVRSSALGEDAEDASFAGQLTSVACQSDGIASAMRSVWASSWSVAALHYQLQHGWLRGVGVLVQERIDSAVSGVLFTESPEPTHQGAMLVEYCAGPGEALVSGQVTPGRFTLDQESPPPASPRARGRVRVGGQGPDIDLAEPWVTTLWQCARAQARRAERPLDIEWTVDTHGRLYVVQTRPITVAADRRVVWSNVNVNENYPTAVCPMLYSIAVPAYTSYFAGLGRLLGVPRRTMEELAPSLRAIIGAHQGRIYYNLTNIHRAIAKLPRGDVLCRYFDQFVGARLGPTTRQRGLVTARIVLSAIWAALSLPFRVARFRRDVSAHIERFPLDGPRRFPIIADALSGFADIRFRLWHNAGIADLAALVAYGALGSFLKRALARADVSGLSGSLVQGDGLESAIPPQKLWELSQKIRDVPRALTLFQDSLPEEILAALEREPALSTIATAILTFLEAYGFRCSGELTLIDPNYQEDPRALIALLAQYVRSRCASPFELAHKRRAARADARRTVARAIGRAPWRRAVFRALAAAAAYAIACRERVRLQQARLYNHLRVYALKLGQALCARGRLDTQEDIFFLTLDEALSLASGTFLTPESLQEQVAHRRLAYQRALSALPPDHFLQNELYGATTPLGIQKATSQGRTLYGTSACGGQVRAPARVLASVRESHKLKPGDILVTRQTDPGWAPVFPLLGGLVIERGGMLSHGAIVAREYGIPAVVGVLAITERVVDGDVLVVDGDAGSVCLP